MSGQKYMGMKLAYISASNGWKSYKNFDLYMSSFQNALR